MNIRGRSVLTVTSIMLLLTLLATPLAKADTGPDKNTTTATNKKESATPTKATEAARGDSNSTGASVGFEREVQQLKQLLQTQGEQLEAQRTALREQQQRLELMEEKLKSARAAMATTTPGADAPASSTDPADPTAIAIPTTPQAEKRMQEAPTKKDWEDRIKQIGPFSFSGDFRLRDEPFFGGPKDQSQVRHRERFRLRFNADARLNDLVSGGLSLASGDLNDPISTNQTTNQFYTRKPFNIDRAFLHYNPGFLKPLTLTGGKFAYPWYNTELTWDKDLNPEGLAQTLAFNFETPVLKSMALVGFELPFAETPGVSLTNKSIVQSAVYGGQLQTVWKFADWLSFRAYGGFYNWHNADPVALAVATANAASPGLGLLKLNNNRAQNSMTVTTATDVVTDEGKPISTGVKTITAAQFASKFGLFDAIARFDIKTPLERWPIAVIGGYVQNTKACANVGDFLPLPANTSTQTFSQSTTAPCDPRQRRGYWLESRFGRAQERGDWQFAYTRIFIERETVLGVFNFSEMRQASNVTQHRTEIFYQAYKNVQLGFTGFFGRPLNFGTTKPPEDILKRLQFDLVYKF